MQTLLDQKFAELTSRRQLELIFVKLRVPVLFKAIKTTKETISDLSLLRRAIPQRFSDVAHRLIPIEVNKLRQALLKDEDEYTRLTSLLNEDKVLLEFLMNAKDYLYMNPEDVGVALQEEFKTLFLPHLCCETKKTRATMIVSGPFCNHCDAYTEFFVDPEQATEVCSVCATAKTDRVTSSSSCAMLDERCLSNTEPYKRLVYFREFLRQLQGKTRVQIPEAVLLNVKTEINKETTSIQDQDVRKALRKLGFSSLIEHVPAILSKLNPTFNPVEISSTVLNVLCSEFAKLDTAFMKYKQSRKKYKQPRKSMLSYNFICHKICEEKNFKSYANIWKISKSEKMRKKHEDTYVQIKSFI